MESIPRITKQLCISKTKSSKEFHSFVKKILGINKGAKVVTKLKIGTDLIIDDQSEVDKILAETCTQKLGANLKTKIKFPAYPPTEFIPNFPTFLEISHFINTSKSFGGENIPLELINNDTGKLLAYDQLRLTLSQTKGFHKEVYSPPSSG